MYLTAQELPAGDMHGVVASKYLVYRSRSIGRHGRELLTGTRRMSTQASLPWWEGDCTPYSVRLFVFGRRRCRWWCPSSYRARAISCMGAARSVSTVVQRLFHASVRHQTQSSRCSGCHGMASLRQQRERTCAFSCRTRLPLTS
jgi:hypothetical protein